MDSNWLFSGYQSVKLRGIVSSGNTEISGTIINQPEKRCWGICVIMWGQDSLQHGAWCFCHFPVHVEVLNSTPVFRNHSIETGRTLLHEFLSALETVWMKIEAPIIPIIRSFGLWGHCQGWYCWKMLFLIRPYQNEVKRNWDFSSGHGIYAP